MDIHIEYKPKNDNNNANFVPLRIIYTVINNNNISMRLQ